jgi:DNA-binding transcriptional ArsR family regulator
MSNKGKAEPKLGFMEAVLLYVMCKEAINNKSKLKEGFTVKELSKILMKSESRIRYLLNRLKEKGFVSDIPIEFGEGRPFYVLGEPWTGGISPLFEGFSREVIEKIVVPGGGVEKKWYLKVLPEDGKSIAEEVLKRLRKA